MSFRETQAAVLLLQPVFSDGRGGLAVRGPPIAGVEGRRLAFSISWGGEFTQQSFASVYFRMSAAAVLFACCRFYWLDFGIVFFFKSLSGGKRMHGNLAGWIKMVAGTAGEPMLVDVFSHCLSFTPLVLSTLFWAIPSIPVSTERKHEAAQWMMGTNQRDSAAVGDRCCSWKGRA